MTITDAPFDPGGAGGVVDSCVTAGVSSTPASAIVASTSTARVTTRVTVLLSGNH